MNTSSVLLIGKPNSGKSLLFNRLTGLRQKVANFPGVTVEVKRGQMENIDLCDYPGIYSLNAVTEDEKIAVEKLKAGMVDPSVSGIVCVLDITRLERSLMLGLQVKNLSIENNKPVVYALNMMDEMIRNKLDFDLVAFEKELGHPVISVSAKTGQGLATLTQCIQGLAGIVPNGQTIAPDQVARRAKEISAKFMPRAEFLLRGQTRLDQFFLSGFFGTIAFAAIMLALFQSIFTWAEPLMTAIEDSIAWISTVVTPLLPTGIIADFFNDAILGGIGSFVVFVPQIFILIFVIGLLEDSGYLARAAVICHKPLSWFGLSGRSFVPLLSGHACAIPAIFAARTIESPRKRLLTIAAIPLVACSARLPVYALLIGALIPATTFAGGLFGYQGLVFFGLYLFGLVTALLVSGFLSRTLYKTKSDAPFIIELPPYRMPGFIPIFRRAANSAWQFMAQAGLVIFCVTVVVWVLGYFPNGTGHLETSWLATLGHWVEPIFSPLGLDWKYAVGILASFLAREVFVGTLGTMFGIEGADENIAGLAENMQNSGFTLASGVGLLVFYAIALQCVSTLAVLKRETGSRIFPIAIFAAYGLLAYVLAIIAYQIVNLVA